MLYRLGKITIIKNLAGIASFNSFTVSFDAGKMTQRIELIPTYINPDPNE